MRRFARTPGLTLALLLTIAMGVGSSVAVDGFTEGLIRVHSPLASLDRVVSVFARDAHDPAGPFSYQDYLALDSHRDGFDRDKFEWIGAAQISPRDITLSGQSPILSVAAVTPRLADLLQLSLNGGVVISQDLWQNEFHGKADLSSEQIRIDGVRVHVAGVAPKSLEGIYRDRPVDLWMPLDEKAAHGADRNVWLLGRLRRGVSIGQSLGDLRVIPYSGMMPEMAEGFWRVRLLLGFAAGLVFFIVCANVASFLLGRAYARSHETSVRIALGASRTQLAREVLADSVVISVAGGATGLLLAVWISHILPALLFEQDAERLVFAPNLVNIVTASATYVAITIVCGLLPFVAISHDRPAMVLRRESAGPSTGIRRLRVGLIVAQMASCCVLVISTAFLFDGLRAAFQTSAGHRLGHPILATVQSQPYIEMRYFEDVQRATQPVAGVFGVAWASQMPGGQPAWQYFRVEPPGLPLRQITLDKAPFTADSIKRFAMPPVAGRLFGVADLTCRTAVVNEDAARALFNDDTLGRTIFDSTGPATIIGIVAMRRTKVATKRSPPTIYYYNANRNGPPPAQIDSARFRAPIVKKLKRAELDSNIVSPGYFAAMGWPLVEGGVFTGDSMPTGCRVAVVNQEAADLYFDGKAVGSAVIDAIGRRTAIIGVVRSAPLGTFARRAEPAIYFPMAQDYLRRMTLILGAREASDPILADLRSRIESVPGRGTAPLVIRTLEEQLSQTALSPLRIATVMIGASATLALVLSALGLFGALNDAARERRRQLAIRIALGAQRRHVFGLVVSEGGRLACAGTFAGTFVSLLLSRMLARITPVNSSPALWIWLAAPLVLAGAVAIASVLPARRASLVNPLTIMGGDN